jgi:protease II
MKPPKPLKIKSFIKFHNVLRADDFKYLQKNYQKYLKQEVEYSNTFVAKHKALIQNLKTELKSFIPSKLELNAGALENSAKKTISPDQSKVAYLVYENDGEQGTLVIKDFIRKQNIRRVPNVFNFAWSVDSNILFTRIDAKLNSSKV